MRIGHLSTPVAADPWSETQDLQDLNAHVNQALIRALADLKTRSQQLFMPGSPKRSLPAAPMPFVVLGPAGAGKTHLFCRLRQVLGTQAILVYIRPIDAREMRSRYVLGQILQQLNQETGGVPQLHSLVGAILAMNWDGSPDELSIGLELLQGLEEKERVANLETCLAGQLERIPDLDEGYLEFLMAAPFKEVLTRRSILAYLGGQDITEAQARRIGVREPLSDDRVLPALRTLARIASPSKPLVLVFDQLENVARGESAREQILAYGNLIMDLADEVRHLVIVQMALDTEWERSLASHLTEAQKARVCGPVLRLELPTPFQGEELMRMWLKEVGTSKPWPWPFTEPRLKEILGRNPTPRMLLQELRGRLDTESGAPSAPENPEMYIAKAWEEARSKAFQEIAGRDEGQQGALPELLNDGLLKLVALSPSLTYKGRQKEWIRLGRSPSQDVVVAHFHKNHHKSMLADLKNFSALQGPRIALREQWRPVPATWGSSLEQIKTLRAQKDVEWHEMTHEDVLRLLALDQIVKCAVSRDLGGPDGRPVELAEVEAWVKTHLEPEQWPISRLLGAWDSLGAQLPDEESLLPPLPMPAEIPPKPGPQTTVAGDRSHSSAGLFLRRCLGDLRIVSLPRLRKLALEAGHDLNHGELVMELKGIKGLHWIGKDLVALEGEIA